MSKGSKIVSVRFPDDEHEAMLLRLESLRVFHHGSEVTLGEFIRSAVEEKIAKMERSRTWRKKKREGRS